MSDEDHSAGKKFKTGDWLNDAFRNQFGDIPGKWVSVMDIDLAIYTKKNVVWLLEKKAMLGTLERNGQIFVPLTQILFLRELAAKLGCHTLMIVYDFDHKVDYLYTLNIKEGRFDTARVSGRMFAVVPKKLFEKLTVPELMQHMRLELRSTKWRRGQMKKKVSARSEGEEDEHEPTAADKHVGHFVLCGNCGGIVSTHYHDDNPDFVLDPDVARDALRLGLGECNCFVQLDLWCEKCQELFS